MAQSNPAREAQTRLRKLEAEFAHTRQRYELGKARSNGDKLSRARLKELERLFKSAELRLKEARTDG